MGDTMPVFGTLYHARLISITSCLKIKSSVIHIHTKIWFQKKHAEAILFLSFKNVEILHQQHNYSAYQHSKLSSTIIFVIWIKCSPM